MHRVCFWFGSDASEVFDRCVSHCPLQAAAADASRKLADVERERDAARHRRVPRITSLRFSLVLEQGLTPWPAAWLL